MNTLSINYQITFSFCDQYSNSTILPPLSDTSKYFTESTWRPHEIDGDTEAQRNYVTAPRPHRLQVANLGFNRKSDSTTQTETIYLILVAKCWKNSNSSDMFATSNAAKIAWKWIVTATLLKQLFWSIFIWRNRIFSVSQLYKWRLDMIILPSQLITFLVLIRPFWNFELVGQWNIKIV